MLATENSWASVSSHWLQFLSSESNHKTQTRRNVRSTPYNVHNYSVCSVRPFLLYSLLWIRILGSTGSSFLLESVRSTYEPFSLFLSSQIHASVHTSWLTEFFSRSLPISTFAKR